MKFEVDPRHPTERNGQKLHFWLFRSFKHGFLRFLNDPAWVIGWPNHVDHLVPSKYAISSRTDASNSRKRPKTLFLAIWIIQKGISVVFEWSSMGHTMANSCTPFSSIEICNIKSTRCTKLKKMAKNLVFGYLDHSKRHFVIFEWSSMGDTMAISCTPLSSIKICNIKLSQWTKSKI